jgi:hypothetical protein
MSANVTRQDGRVNARAMSKGFEDKTALLLFKKWISLLDIPGSKQQVAAVYTHRSIHNTMFCLAWHSSCHEIKAREYKCSQSQFAIWLQRASFG